VAQDPPPDTSAFVPVWSQDGSLLSPSQLDEVLKAMKKQQANPANIVVLMHGYHTLRDESSSQFQQVAQRARAEYQRRRDTAVVVGIQWESALPGAGVPWEAEDVYFEALGRARNVGHQVSRQVLLMVQKNFPKAHISVWGHSLGCEVAAACLMPEMQYGDDAAKSSAFQPTQDIHIDMLALCGSDLDYDIWYKSHVNFKAKRPRTRLAWMTISPYTGERDKTLQVRAVSRGRAGGAGFPRMTQEQCDLVYKNRAILFDNRNIPTDHALLEYYSEDRVQRLIATADSLTNPKAPKPVEMVEAEQVLAAPAQVDALTPFLDSPNLSTQAYALWRLDHLLCGSSVHLCDETIDNMAQLMRNQPARVRKERPSSPCKILSRGLWPTETQMTRAGAPSWED
jgi:hypothetical protein